jgi:hypothetical protein
MWKISGRIPILAKDQLRIRQKRNAVCDVTLLSFCLSNKSRIERKSTKGVLASKLPLLEAGGVSFWNFFRLRFCHVRVFSFFFNSRMMVRNFGSSRSSGKTSRKEVESNRLLW